MSKARKWVAIDFGGPEVLRSVAFEVPAPRPGEVTIAALAGSGDLTVPVAQTFPFDDAPAALAMLTSPHPAGKLALVVDGAAEGAD